MMRSQNDKIRTSLLFRVAWGGGLCRHFMIAPFLYKGKYEMARSQNEEMHAFLIAKIVVV